MAFDMGNYVDVATRVKLLLEAYPNASINCSPPEVQFVGDRAFIAVTCLIDCNDGSGRTARASAWEPFPGKTPYTRDSEAMNAETSAVGRACGLLGFGLTGSLATANEVANRRDSDSPGEGPRSRSEGRLAPVRDLTPSRDRKPTEKQIAFLKRLMIERSMRTDDIDWDDLSAAEVSEMIDRTKEVPVVK